MSQTKPTRGEEIQTNGGAKGRFVGQAPALKGRGKPHPGTLWVCYGSEEEYARMCETFDRYYR